MPIQILDPILSTDIIIALFSCALLLTLRRKKDATLFPLELTQELKGLAILAVVFSHIGYFLSVDHDFLFPLSIMAGVGVDLFLFLSGYGLTVSSLKETLPPGTFYKKRLLKLFTSLWIVTLILFTFDFLILHISYSPSYMIRSLFGFFPSANLWHDVNSPFWFITPMLFYYLLFPFIFSKKRPWLAAVLLGALSYFIVQLQLPTLAGVSNFYQLHFIAFPLGIAFAWLLSKLNVFSRLMPNNSRLRRLAYYILLVVLLCVIGYTAYYSGVGEDPLKAQTISLITMSALLFFFILKKFEIRALYLFGFYSYEIYLIHWPLMARYDIFFKRFPGWLATLFYLGLFLLLSWVLRKLSDQIYKTSVQR